MQARRSHSSPLWAVIVLAKFDGTKAWAGCDQRNAPSGRHISLIQHYWSFTAVEGSKL